MTDTRTNPAAPAITVANVEMAEIWDGPEGDEWTENAARYDATDRWIGARYEAELGIQPADRVLDIGCGTGKLTRAAARQASSGDVLGVDLSSRMLELARKQSAQEGLTNVEFLRADAQVHPFDEGAFDVAMSSFGAMFFNDPTAAFTNIRRSLRPGGRLVFIAWQPFDRNEWLTALFRAVAVGREIPSPPAGEPGPFGLADRDQVLRLLEAAGFVDGHLSPVVEPFCAGADEDDAWQFLSTMGIVQGMTEGLDDADREQAFDNLRSLIAEHATPDGVLLDSASWLITATNR